MYSSFLFSAVLFASFLYTLSENNCDRSLDVCEQSILSQKYIFYDVNPHEGFNLRRDVYMRLAIFFNRLKRDGINWKLILPPWLNLPHWRSVKASNQTPVPWGVFFDLKSLQSYAPVVEMFEFLEDHPNFTLDYVITLQHYPDIWNDEFHWTEKWNISDCQRSTSFIKSHDGLFRGSLYGYEISAKKVLCVSFQGSASLVEKVVEAFPGRFIAFRHAETIVHDSYGGSNYWKCRASMKFSKDLMSIADMFRETFVTSNNGIWKSDSGFTNGYPYLCVHLRRRDYLSGHPKQVPSVNYAAKQVKKKLKQTELNLVYLATDAFDQEKEEFESALLPYKVIQYVPSDEVLRKFQDGGVAIIDQIICSQARYFIGTYESTFSFRIQEERELLNFHPDSTFNRLCGDEEVDCKQPTRWRKVD